MITPKPYKLPDYIPPHCIRIRDPDGVVKAHYLSVYLRRKAEHQSTFNEVLKEIKNIRIIYINALSFIK